MRTGGNGMLLRQPCSVSDADFKAGYRRKSLRVAMTSKFSYFFVQGTDTFRHGDGVEDALYLDISGRF